MILGLIGTGVGVLRGISDEWLLAVPHPYTKSCFSFLEDLKSKNDMYVRNKNRSTLREIGESVEQAVSKIWDAWDGRKLPITEFIGDLSSGSNSAE